MLIDRSFFGMMYQGSSIDADGRYVAEPYYPIPVGTLRTWDTGAVLTFRNAGLRSQVEFAESLGAQVLYTFGFSGDPAYPPPPEALIQGSKNRPTREFLSQQIDAVLDFSLALDDADHPRIAIYEEANEPSVSSLYWDGLVEEAYEQSTFIYSRIKSRDPSALILSPSFNALDQEYGLKLARDYIRLMARYGAACDGLANHIYTTSMENLYVQLANFDQVRREFSHLPICCTEFNGPWEAFDVMALRGFKCVVLNGQQPPAPYYDEALRDRWISMVNRMTTAGPTPPSAPTSKGGCRSRFNPFKR